MKISYISDLHLDFWIPFIPSQDKWESRTKDFIRKLIETDKGEREVLCLGGDYSHFNNQTKWMLQEFSKVYERVFLIFGNHDFYLISKNQENKYKNHSFNRIKEIDDFAIWSLHNVVPLIEGRVIEYKGIRFGGDTMWYPLKTTEQKVFFNNISNDSKLIKGFNIELEHLNSISNYETMMYDRGGIDIMLSHVPLCYIKSHSHYNSTSCYYTPVPEIPKYVIQAHSHEREIYTKDESLLYMNCMGYPEDDLGVPTILSFNIDK